MGRKGDSSSGSRRPISRKELALQRNISVLLIAVLLVVVTVVSVREDPFALAGQNPEAVRRGLDLLTDATQLIEQHYAREVDEEKLYENAVQGMLQGLDRFSSFIPMEELDEFNKRVKGSFGGVGIVIGMEAGWLTVITPIEDGPSYRAGVLAGDRIIKINGKSTEGITLDEAVKKLTGKPGTKVTYTVIHEATLDRETFTITREIIHIKTVKGIRRNENDQWQYLLEGDEGVAYIRLTSFTADTVEDLRSALKDAKEQGMESLVLDLRWNGGGMLSAAVGVADVFLNSGVVVSTRGRKDPEERFEAHEEDTVGNFPMVILVNDRSASASEIVGGALQDHSRAIVLGERTFGKGSVQRIFPVQNGQAAVRLTVAKYYLPSGRCIHREEDAEEWGVDPLIEVKMTPQEYLEVFRARRESDVLKGNGNNAEEPSEETEDDVEMHEGLPPEEGPDAEKGEEEGPGAGVGQEGAAEEQKGMLVAKDRQLARAIDVLRMLPVVQKFEALQAGTRGD